MENVIVVLVLIAGAVLHLSQFLYNRSLWIDEAWVALNLIHKNSLELLRPLDYGQVAPVLFLQIEKLFSTLLPNVEYGFWIFPFICFFAALYFFYKIVKKNLPDSSEIVMALSLFVFNIPFIWYSSETKQYMVEVFVFLSMFYFTQKDYQKVSNKYYTLGIAGVLSVFLSNVAPIALSVCGIYLLYDYFSTKREKAIKPLLIVAASWLSAFLVYYFFFIYKHPLDGMMKNWWSKCDAFPPLNPIEMVQFLYERFEVITFSLSSFNPKVGWCVYFLFISGIIRLIWTKQIKLLIFTCVPILLHFILSIIELYPFVLYSYKSYHWATAFYLRLVLYILPCIMIICSISFGFFVRFIFDRLKIKKLQPFLLIVIPVIFILSGSSSKFKISRHEIKTSITYIQENIQKDENLYLTWQSAAAFKYYNDTGFVKISSSQIKGMVDGGESIAGLIPEDAEKFCMEGLKQLKGKYWIIMDPIFFHRNLELFASKLKEFTADNAWVCLYEFGKSETAVK
ncbi:MAG: hypothetical protein LBM08_08655 [Dysgonamonadaceae bacterium]|nr:hypothetical protein [Dysgonamonadaceae bacterium]